jgi:hypothetical protein
MKNGSAALSLFKIKFAIPFSIRRIAFALASTFFYIDVELTKSELCAARGYENNKIQKSPSLSSYLR